MYVVLAGIISDHILPVELVEGVEAAVACARTDLVAGLVAPKSAVVPNNGRRTSSSVISAVAISPICVISARTIISRCGSGIGAISKSMGGVDNEQKEKGEKDPLDLLGTEG